jgi:hypothetical protein
MAVPGDQLGRCPGAADAERNIAAIWTPGQARPSPYGTSVG